MSLFQASSAWVSELDEYEWPASTSAEQKLTEIARTIWERKGKRLRPHLVYWLGEAMEIPPERLALHAWAAEAVHTATLLHDDVIDQASMRRGGPSANRVYDNTLPVISGDYLLAQVIHRVARESTPSVLVALCETLKDLCQGECLQYEMRFRIAPSEENFREIATLKTGSLFGWCAMVAPLLRGSTLAKPVGLAIRAFGVLFQWTDDLLDVTGTKTKGRWTDLREGKLNFATWNMIQADPGLKMKVGAAFEERAIPESLIAGFEAAARDGRVMDAVRERLEAQARSSLALAGALPSAEAGEELQKLVRLCLERSY